MDHVQADDQRDPQAALLHSNPLQLIVFVRILQHNGADQALPDVVLLIVPLGLAQFFSQLFLADLSVHGHFDQFFKGYIETTDQGG